GALLLVFLFLGRALRPLRQLSGALAGIEQGEYHTRVPPVGLSDIDAITARYNHMAGALAASHADNLALTERSLEIQEQERRHLARELHDEMGQSITAIKALAVSIRERAVEREPTLAERAATITDVSSDIYARVRRMIARLHPVVLDELGLVAALEQMVDDWNSYHAECFCRLDIARDLPSLSAAARIGLYRIAQEALTNIARHAGASEARLVLARDGVDAVTLEVSDDGRGFAPGSRRRGLGLTGIAERVETLGGSLALDAGPGAGVRLRVRLPLLLDVHGESQFA
ncbi:MAG: histidine kinase, partial [Gammaproteobacteria bacterium]